MRALVTVLMIFLVSFTGFAGPLDESQDSIAGFGGKKKHPCRRILRALELPTALVAIPLALAVTKRLVDHATAMVQGQTYLGQGIFFDAQKAESFLSEEQRKLLTRVDENEVEILQAYNSLLVGDYDKSIEKLEGFYPARRDAHTYFNGGNALAIAKGKTSGFGKRGVCRNKVCVLKGIADHYGIRAQVISSLSTDPERQGHEFLLLPDYDLVLDPIISAEPIPYQEALKNPYFEGMSFVNHSEDFGGYWYWVVDSLAR